MVTSCLFILTACESIVKVVSIHFHNIAFLLCTNSNNCDNGVHRITFCHPKINNHTTGWLAINNHTTGW